jgi:hypothetical protein
MQVGSFKKTGVCDGIHIIGQPLCVNKFKRLKNRGSACSGVRYCGEKAWGEWSMEALSFRQVGELFKNLLFCCPWLFACLFFKGSAS